MTNAAGPEGHHPRSIGQCIELIAEVPSFCGVCFRVLGIPLVPSLICVATDSVEAASQKQ